MSVETGARPHAHATGPAPARFGNVLQELTSGRYPFFSTLVAAVQYAARDYPGLVRSLESAQITVLCPTNAAFQRAGFTLGQDGCIMLNGGRLPTSAVHTLLLHHVFAGRENALQTQTVPSLEPDRTLRFFTDSTMRTTVIGGDNDSEACVLLQGFKSTNADFAAIGRVLL
jgi:hypothetical protein